MVEVSPLLSEAEEGASWEGGAWEELSMKPQHSVRLPSLKMSG